MKYCSQCGAPNSDEARFCEKCGNAWAAAPQAPAPAPAPAAPAPAPAAPAPAAPTAPAPAPAAYPQAAPAYAPAPAAPAAKRLNPALIIVLAVVLVGILGACGLGWAIFLRPMDAATYEDRVSEYVVSTADSVTQLGDTFNSMDMSDDEPLGQENLAQLRDAVDQCISDVKGYRGKLQRLRAPKEYKSAHARLITGYDEMIGGLEGLKDLLNKVSADDTSTTLAEKFTDESNDFSTALEKSSTDMQRALKDMGLYDSLSEDLSNMF